MKITIGFELQTANMSFEMDRPSSMVSTTRSLYSPIERTDLHLKNTDIEVYADSLSQAEDYENSKKLKKYFREKYRMLQINDSLYLPTSELPNYFFNDAEFIVTYRRPHTVSSKYASILKFIVSRTLNAMNSIESYLKEKAKLKKINKISAVPHATGKRQVDETSMFPYSNYYIITGNQVEYTKSTIRAEGDIYPENLILLVRKNVKAISYYVQTTMGVELRCVWDVMIMLGKEYMKNPKAVKNEVQYIKRMMKDEEELSKNHPSSKEEKNQVVKIVYLLFMYSCWTNVGKGRKPFPFIVRHYFMDVLKLLTRPQFELLCSWIDPNQQMPGMNMSIYDNANELYYDECRDMSVCDHVDLRTRQKVLDVTVYYVGADEKNVLDTPILFEFRYMNSVLNHLISSRRGTHDHMTVKDIEKILRGL